MNCFKLDLSKKATIFSLSGGSSPEGGGGGGEEEEEASGFFEGEEVSMVAEEEVGVIVGVGDFSDFEGGSERRK